MSNVNEMFINNFVLETVLNIYNENCEIFTTTRPFLGTNKQKTARC